MRGQKYTLCVEFGNETIRLKHPNDRLNKIAEFCIVDSRLRLDSIKCTTGPIEHVEFKSDGTMIWYKEEGGQSNALCVEVRLEDSLGNLILGQAVPFELQCLTRFMNDHEHFAFGDQRESSLFGFIQFHSARESIFSLNQIFFIT